jgi:hypothetical protein
VAAAAAAGLVAARLVNSLDGLHCLFQLLCLPGQVSTSKSSDGEGFLGSSLRLRVQKPPATAQKEREAGESEVGARQEDPHRLERHATYRCVFFCARERVGRFFRVGRRG